MTQKLPTVIHRLAQWAKESPHAPAQRYKRGGEWKTYTASDFKERVYFLALFLESKGFKGTPRGTGVVLAYNSPEWVQIELATLLVGGLSAGIYPNSTAKDIGYILDHTECRLLSVQNKAYFEKIAAGGMSLPKSVKTVIVFEHDPALVASIQSANQNTNPGLEAFSIDEALAQGKKIAETASKDQTFESLLSRIDPKAGSILIYTSGTTGNPKGALLSHDNLVFTADFVAENWSLPFAKGSMFSFLPLCHVAEQLQNIAVGISQRYTVSFATKFENVSQELPEVQPALLLCVPRLWEKMMESVLYKVGKSQGLKKKLALQAFEVGARVAKAKFSKKIPNPIDLAQLLVLDRIVLSKIRAAMGLKNAVILASGAAKLPTHVTTWFRCLGLEILETYGQTESTGLICMTERGADTIGSVGPAIPQTRFKLGPDQEILTQGRHVFVEYFKDPASTASTLEGGWLHTGDLGTLTDKGTVQITGRKKEVMKTSGGKMIAPMPIEEALKAAEIISQVCMVGDGRKYLAALITLSENALKEVARIPGSVSGLIVTEPGIVGAVKKEVDTLNKTLSSYEQIKRFAVLAKDFNLADGEMTPTLKVKRAVIETHYRDVIEKLYNE